MKEITLQQAEKVTGGIAPFAILARVGPNQFLRFLDNVYCTLTIMKKAAFFFAVVSMAIAPLSFAYQDIDKVMVSAQRDPQWSSYSKAYKALKEIEGFDAPHELAQLYFWLQPKRDDVRMTDIRLRLLGPHTDLELPVDNLGRTLVPIDEVAAREDAEFLINRSAGSFKFSNVVGIKPTTDGLYPLDYLKKGCEQARQVFVYGNRWRLASLSLRGKTCIGVRFQSTSAPSVAPVVQVIDESGKAQVLPSKASTTYILFANWQDAVKVRAADPALSLTMIIR